MKELLKSLKDNLQISDIIALLSMIGSIIAAIFSWISKRKAKESEKQTEQYARNADEANQAKKKHY